MKKFIVPLFLLSFVWLFPYMASADATKHSPPKHILFIMTSNKELFGTGKKTGSWFDELATPYYKLKEAGNDISFCTIKGGEAPIDPESLVKKTKSVDRFLKDDQAMHALKNTPSIAEVDFNSFDVLFLVGGHGALWDLLGNIDLDNKMRGLATPNKIIVAIDHAGVALLSMTGKGPYGITGRKIAATTQEEEAAQGLTGLLPVYVDKSLATGDVGAIEAPAKAFQPQAFRDGNFITGQNAASTEKVTALLLDALK